jgi:hypothetical protein
MSGQMVRPLREARMRPPGMVTVPKLIVADQTGGKQQIAGVE